MLHPDPPSADENVARLRLELCHTELSTLVELKFLVYDQDENIVRKGPRFYDILPLSELPDDHEGELPDEYL